MRLREFDTKSINDFKSDPDSKDDLTTDPDPSVKQQITPQWQRTYSKQQSKVKTGKRGKSWEGEKWTIDREFARGLLEEQDWRCAITNVRFRNSKYWKPSLDRKNSKIGYTKDNVQYVAACITLNGI